MRIQALDPTLSNQIAAGEVVERPASVLKEVIENSVDAGADRIEVEVERGGKKLLRVRDNGSGIHRDDLVLALRRHATSKIRRFEDLAGIESLGFRGEALPSIASVSRLVLTSCRAGEKVGWRVEAAGSAEVGDPLPAPHGPGTTLEVRDLFFNTPARRKFLRTEKTEYRHLETVLKRLALGHPGLEVVLVHDAKPVFRVRAARSEEERSVRLAKLCGRRFAQSALRVEYASGELALRGWVAGPRADARRGDPQHLFVNARPVRDPIVGHAIRSACAEWLGAEVQPAYVLNLVLPAAEVDVNVHPTKHEVRFRDARLVHDFVARCLRGLPGESLLPGESRAESGRIEVPYPRPETGRRPYREAGIAEAARGYARPRAGRGEEAPAGSAGSTAAPGPVLGPLGGRYVAVAAAGSLRLVDVVAARREALASRLLGALAGGALRSRPFLVPESHPLGLEAAERFDRHEALLLRTGFEYRRAGPERIMLLEAPILLAGIAARDLAAALAASLAELEAGGAEDPARTLVRRLLEHLDPRPEDSERDALLREREVWAADRPALPSACWVDLSPESIRALFDAHRRK